MDTLNIISQVVLALGIFNVWILRFGKSTSWRGGTASNMKEEFEVYGLPAWFVPVIGGLKLLSAVLLIAGIWIPAVILPAAATLVVLMIGAIAMHFKVGDPAIRSLPAFTMLVLASVVAVAGA